MYALSDFHLLVSRSPSATLKQPVADHSTPFNARRFENLDGWLGALDWLYNFLFFR